MEKCKCHCNALVSSATPTRESLEWKGCKYDNVFFIVDGKSSTIATIHLKESNLDLGTMAEIFQSKALYCQH